MKKLFFAVAAFGAFVACSDEEVKDPISAQMQEVNIKATLPAEATAYMTRSAASRNSSLGGLTQVTDKDIRFILEVFEATSINGTDTTYTSVNQFYQTKDAGSSTANFSLRLIPANYKFVLWTDFVANGENKSQTTGTASNLDLYYNTASLKTISLKGAWTGNEEARDAYTGTALVDLKSSSVVTNMTLRRPFGKIRVVTNDFVNDNAYQPTSVTVTYSGDFGTEFDAMTGTTTSSKNGSFSYTAANFQNKENNSDASVKVLTWDYLFPTGQGYNLTLATTDGDKNTTRQITQIPVQTNRLTTLSGNVMTYGSTLNVTIDDMFETPGSDVNLPE